MKTDLYTKVILTIIAVCLFCIVVKNTSFVSEAYAEKKTSKIDVNIVEIGGFDLSTTSSMIVPPLPVKIRK